MMIPCHRKGERRSGAARLLVLAALSVALPGLSGCVTIAQFRKLEDEVWALRQGAAPGPRAERERVADMGARMDAMQAELEALRGELEVVEHGVERALEEARRARAASAGPGAPYPGGPPGTSPAPPPGGGAAAAAPSEPFPSGATSEEVAAYREAYAAWRAGDHGGCVDRFRDFLQTYASSAHADDAAYWLADCYFKTGDYKTAVLRFDDVVARYPSGNKAPDALYRQGEALLRLGPGYAKAAGKAFERVLTEYPQSNRAEEARRQLDLLGSG